VGWEFEHLWVPFACGTLYFVTFFFNWHIKVVHIYGVTWTLCNVQVRVRISLSSNIYHFFVVKTFKILSSAFLFLHKYEVRCCYLYSPDYAENTRTYFSCLSYIFEPVDQTQVITANTLLLWHMNETRQQLSSCAWLISLNKWFPVPSMLSRMTGLHFLRLSKYSILYTYYFFYPLMGW
jgi:hypothetical protein